LETNTFRALRALRALRGIRGVGVLGGIVDTRHVGALDDFALRNGPEVHLVWLCKWQNAQGISDQKSTLSL